MSHEGKGFALRIMSAGTVPVNGPSEKWKLLSTSLKSHSYYFCTGQVARRRNMLLLVPTEPFVLARLLVVY